MENFNKENNAPEVENPDQEVVGADGVKQDVAKQDLVFFYFGMFGICLTSLVFSQLAPVINTFMEAHLLPKIAGVMESIIDFIICVFTLVKMLAYSKPSSDVFKRCLLVACGVVLYHLTLHHSFIRNTELWEASLLGLCIFYSLFFGLDYVMNSLVNFFRSFRRDQKNQN